MFYGLDQSEVIMTQWVFVIPAHIERLNSSALCTRGASNSAGAVGRIPPGRRSNIRHSSSPSRRAIACVRISWALTRLMHRFLEDGPLQMAEPDYIATSRAAQTNIAENYVGLPV